MSSLWVTGVMSEGGGHEWWWLKGFECVKWGPDLSRAGPKHWIEHDCHLSPSSSGRRESWTWFYFIFLTSGNKGKTVRQRKMWTNECGTRKGTQQRQGGREEGWTADTKVWKHRKNGVMLKMKSTLDDRDKMTEGLVWRQSLVGQEDGLVLQSESKTHSKTSSTTKIAGVTKR